MHKRGKRRLYEVCGEDLNEVQADCEYPLKRESGFENFVNSNGGKDADYEK